MDVVRSGALIAATLAVALMAGLYYAFSCAVMPGLREADDRTFVAAMQQINRAILNGWFFLTLLGSLVLTALASLVHLPSEQRGALPWIVAGLLLYTTTLVITATVNVPLNNELDRSTPVVDADFTAVRRRFEPTWVRWNLVRAVVCTAALGCLAWALVVHGRIGA